MDALPIAPDRRERGKLEKRRRIKEAARAVFRERGFDGATTREIAERADVASATLFAYVRDKRDLLLMVVNDELDAIGEAVPARTQAERPLAHRLAEYFAPRYAFWAEDPVIARHVLHQRVGLLLEEHDIGPETRRYVMRRDEMMTQLAAIIGEDQRAGRIDAGADPVELAWIFLSIYHAEQRAWLAASVPDPAEGVRRLRRLYEIIVTGIAPDAPAQGAGRC